MKRKSVHVTLFSEEQYDAEWPPEQPDEFLAWFREKLGQIPTECRESARVELGSVLSYEGSHYATLKITYWRPETDAEMAQREAEEDFKARLQQEKDMRTLAALKAKYGL